MREWKKCVPACYVARMCLIPHDVVLFLLFFFLQKLTWRSGQADREMCAVKGKHRVSRGEKSLKITFCLVTRVTHDTDRKLNYKPLKTQFNVVHFPPGRVPQLHQSSGSKK